jgi:hypothetical protein
MSRRLHGDGGWELDEQMLHATQGKQGRTSEGWGGASAKHARETRERETGEREAAAAAAAAAALMF